MKICHLLKVEHIFLDVSLAGKDDVLQYISKIGVKTGVVKDQALLHQGLQKREDLMSTGIGSGIALPHTTTPEVINAAVFLIRLAKGIDFEALDSLPVDIVLSLIIPENNTPLHLQLLAGVSWLCKVPEFLSTLRQEKNPSALWEEIKSLEEEMAFH
jgi:mannitol/fructose-specific phosphotransferase system IIA component (Ntr-type)